MNTENESFTKKYIKKKNKTIDFNNIIINI